MKKLNRLMALVLAGVMTLLMLTGCCVKTDALGDKVIEETFKIYNAERTEGELTNDKELRALVDKLLNLIDPETDEFDMETYEEQYGDKALLGEIFIAKGEGGKYYAEPVTEENFNNVMNTLGMYAEATVDAEVAAVSYRAVNGKLYVGMLYTKSK